MGESKGTISNAAAFMMIGVALGFDGIQMLLDYAFIGVVADSFIDLIAGLLFGIWFAHNDVPAGFGTAGTTIIEFIPGVNALPAWTGFVVYKVITNRLQKAAGAAEEATE